MPEKVLRQISAGNRPIFEIVENKDVPSKVIVRIVEEPSQHIALPKSVLQILGKALMEIGRKESK